MRLRAASAVVPSSLVAASLLLASVGLVAPAHAQLDPGSDPASSSIGPDDARLRRLAAETGPRARVIRDEDGRARMLMGARVAPTSSDAVQNAAAFLGRHADELAIGRGWDLRLERVQQAHGLTVVRFARWADVGEGQVVPVVDASIVVRSTADGSIDFVSIDRMPSRVSRVSMLDADPAQLAMAAAPAWADRTDEPRLVALAHADEGAVIAAWQVDVAGEAFTQHVRVWIDARDGRVIAVVPRAAHALGRVYETNPTLSMDMTADVELTDLTSRDRLTGRYVRVSSCESACGRGAALIQRAVADETSGDFLFDPDRAAYDDAFAEVNAYHHVSRIATYMRTTHGFTWSCSGSSTLQVVVNYVETARTPYDNAAFSPGFGSTCGNLLFGQGNSGDFAYDADVVYHEFGHAVTDSIASITGFDADDLGVTYEPLAINEGTSDYWAGTVQGNAQIAESFSGLGSVGSHGSLRVIDNDMTCPYDLIGEGHADGMLWGGLGWDVREAIGAEKADALMFAAVSSVGTNPSLSTGSETYLATAMALETMGTLTAADVTAVRAALDARTLIGCRRIVPLDDGEVHQGYSGTEFVTGATGRSLAPVHYRIDVPADATSVTVRISRLTFAGSYTVRVNEGTTVRPVGGTFRQRAAFPVGNSGEVVITRDSEYALPRCQTMYMAISVDDLTTAGQSLYSIRAEMERSGMDEECPELPVDGGMAGADAGSGADAGVSEMPTSSSGCSCRTSGAPASGEHAGLALVGLAAVLVARRRRSA